MNILKNEMRQGLKGLLLWGLIIGGTIVLCVALFPDLKKELEIWWMRWRTWADSERRLA